MSELKYTAKYFRPGPLGGKWIKHSNVVGDGFVENSPLRFLKLDDDSMVYYPQYFETIFCKNRHLAILQKASKDAGQPVQGV